MRKLFRRLLQRPTTKKEVQVRKVRLMIAGGGTGGHIFPAVAVANAVRRLHPDADILFVGAIGKMEMEKVPAAGFPIKGLDIAGFNRQAWLKNATLPFKLVKSFWQVRSIFREFRPNAVFGVGGYSSYPVLRYAQSKGIATFLHESNAYAGKSNRLLAKKAVSIFVGTPGMEKFFPPEKIMLTGNPVRREILDINMSAGEARLHFNLNPEQPALLVIGGSQGAASINAAIQKGIPSLIDAGWQLIWQTGKPYFPVAAKAVEGMKGIWCQPFISKMDQAYAAADLVVSRSGAMSVSELCLAGKPAVFVPFPYAAEDHQTVNAMTLVNRDAACIVPDREAGEQLMTTVLELARDAVKREDMSSRMKPLAIRNADQVIAREIVNKIKGSDR